MPQNRRLFLTSLPALGMAPTAASAQTGSTTPRLLFARLLSAVEAMPLVDTHEHIIPEEERVSQPMDFFTLAGHYAINDVISAGLPADDLERVRNQDLSANERWQAFEPYWEHARFTGYGQALRLAIRDIYGIDDISTSTIGAINERIRSKNAPGLYQSILIDKTKIRYSVLDDYWNETPVKPDQRFFVYARKFDRFVTPDSAAAIEHLEQITGVSIADLNDLKKAMEKSFQQSLDAGMVTVKSTLAYNREILFHEVEATEAGRDLRALMRRGRKMPEGFRRRVVRPYRRLEDHMFHHLIQLAAAHRIPVQIHTGLHAGNGNFIQNANATHLTNLFFLYPHVKFDLFHIGYPYQGELSVLAKIFPNVHVDFCWAHIISESLSRRALHEMLETVPVNKIFGFGGDYRYPELSYAHAKMARRNVAHVLAEKVASGFCTEDEALEIAHKILDANPDALFGRNAR